MNQKLSKADLRVNYKKTLEISFAIALLLLSVLFFAFAENNAKAEYIPIPRIDPTIVYDIPPTVQHKRPVQPDTPVIPVESDDPEIVDYVEVENIFKIDISRPIYEPIPEEEDIPWFTFVEKKPVLIHREIPYYPDLAKAAYISGTVVVAVTISEKGNVIDAQIFKSIPMLDKVALEAAKKCTFSPAMQRDRYVKVKMYIPFMFKLN